MFQIYTRPKWCKTDTSTCIIKLVVAPLYRIQTWILSNRLIVNKIKISEANDLLSIHVHVLGA